MYDTNNTVVNRKTVSRQAALMPKVEGVPRYKDFNTIRKNHHVKDEEVLRYVPYFGETDDVDLTEAYKVEVRSVEEEEDLERESPFSGRICVYCLGGKILSRIVERYLAINNVTVDQAIKALDENAKKSDPMTIKVDELQEAWFQKTLIDLEDVLDT